MILEKGQRILHETYEVEEFIGRGAFAEVYRVRHLRLNVWRAVKVMDRDAPGVGSTDFNLQRARFEQEAYLGASLSHPHIVQAYDFLDEGDRLYLLMEYMPGGSLRQRIERVKQGGPPLPVDEVVRMALEVAKGLAALHARDIVHRDLKPSNILFDSEGRAKVADLGLAQIPGGPSHDLRILSSNAPPHPGTWGYKSPEQEDSTGPLTAAADLYALGMIIAEALTTHLWRSYLLEHPEARVRDLRPDVPQWLDDLVQRLLEPDLKQRVGKAEEVIQVLEGAPRVPPAPSVSPASAPARTTKEPVSEIRLHPADTRYPSLADAVAALVPGGTLHLAPGVYRLEETLVIDKPLTLLGEDRDMTVVAYRGEGDVVRYVGRGVFVARHITFRHEGDAWGNVMVVEDGLVDFEDCRFTGGVWDEERRYGGDGIVFWQQSAGGRVRACLCDSNGLHGIEVAEQAAPVLAGNRCARNKYDGIVYFGSAGGEARENECVGNGFNGIAVGEYAHPTLRDNICRDNERGNLYVAESAKPVLEGNRC